MPGKVFFGALAVLLTLFLASCATLSQEECEVGDWRSIGAADGANGYPASRIESHASACGDYGIAPNAARYEAGRQEGLGAYCRLERAERDGLRDRRNYNSCQGQIGIAFNRVYSAANAVYDYDRRIASAEANLDGLYAQASAAGLTDEQRAAIRSRIRSARDRLDNLESQRWSQQRQMETIRRREELRLQAAGVAY